ncbi:HpcH/HpaI aldolase/citrate lyase family protein [Sphingosinicella rhizophila]|uniref:CoA ester lyase n=1 Tax=Sphingosinicella rhizophila TaxID=3050082 RepID=A0ABU3Q450_9SPHN|nr:CoA ester lyase [Sphingosinicella sp. GR2756]MDT9597733.1 CoA ester lyase [Sphingosinicella sp. GR2756]
MTHDDLSLCRSLLFLPASNPRAIEKARTLGADMVVLDLEDAVKPVDKEMARTAAVEAAARGFGSSVTAIRVNSPGAWQDRDLEAVKGSAAVFAVVPRTAGRDDVDRVAAGTGKPVLAMIETAPGVLAAAGIAPATSGLIVGTNDLGASLGLRRGSSRQALTTALQMAVIAARAAGVAVFDGVYNKLDDPDGFATECEEGRLFGFDGKSLIHPNQIEAANRIFSADSEEIEAARRLIEAATGGAERFEGEMIEAMHVAQAQKLLAKARA